MSVDSYEDTRPPLLIVWNRAGSELEEIFDRLSTDQLAGRQVVIDCRHKPTLGSAEVSKLIQVRRQLLARDCKLRIQQVMPDAMDVLHLTRLDRLFEIQPAGDN